MLKRLRKLEVLNRFDRINESFPVSEREREFRSRSPRFVPLGDDVEVQIIEVRQCHCGSWVLKGEQKCTYCGKEARGVFSKAWEITRFREVPLHKVANLLQACDPGGDEAPAA
jgi:hypothetical protein